MSKNYPLVISQGCTLRYFGVGVPPGSQYVNPIRQKHFGFQKCYLVGEPMTLTKYPVIFEPEHCVRQKYLIHSCRSSVQKPYPSGVVNSNIAKMRGVSPGVLLRNN